MLLNNVETLAMGILIGLESVLPVKWRFSITICSQNQYEKYQ